MTENTIAMFETIEGKNKVNENLPFLKRKTINCIIKDPIKNKYLVLKWLGHDWHTFIIGGIDENEDMIDAALRKIKEETGHMNLKFTGIIAQNYEAKYYASHKNENRHAVFTGLSFELTNEEKNPVSQKEKSLHEVLWLSPEEVEEKINIFSQFYLWQQYAYKKFKHNEGDVKFSAKYKILKEK